MKRIGMVITIVIACVTFTSCGTSGNYLTQSYAPSTHLSKLDKLKSTLEKPIIVPEEIDLVDTNEETLSKLEESTFISSFEIAVNNIIYEANSYLGTPYRYGGTTRRGIDCSAFMQKIYRVAGIELPRVSYHQARIGVPVSKEELQRGDLIFFSTTSPTRITHVGMVVEVEDGNVKFIHAASSKGVSFSTLSNSYWKRKYRTARRPQKFLHESLVPMSKADKMLASNN